MVLSALLRCRLSVLETTQMYELAVLKLPCTYSDSALVSSRLGGFCLFDGLVLGILLVRSQSSKLGSYKLWAHFR